MLLITDNQLMLVGLRGRPYFYQHYQKRTQSTLFGDPLPPSQKSTLKMLILANRYENAMHQNKHFKKCTAAIDPLPQRTLCTLLKLITILDDPLVGLFKYGAVCGVCLECDYNTEQAQHNLAAAQTKIERIILNITYKDRQTNIWVWQRTKVVDIISNCEKTESFWAGPSTASKTTDGPREDRTSRHIG